MERRIEDIKAEDSHPFNDALCQAWAVYLEHYPEKGESWKRMTPDQLKSVVSREFTEIVVQLSAMSANAAAVHKDPLKRDYSAVIASLGRAADECADTICALVLLRARCLMLASGFSDGDAWSLRDDVEIEESSP